MAFTIEELRKENFAHTYMWEINFPSYSGAFFPASSVKEGTGTSILGEADYGGVSIKYPWKYELAALEIQMVEVADRKVITWLEEWYNVVYDKENLTVSLLATAARPVTILHMNYGGSVAKTNQYLVVPESEATWELSSEKNNALSINLTLEIVGE